MAGPHCDDRDSYLQQFRLQLEHSFGTGAGTDTGTNTEPGAGAGSRLSHQTAWCIRIDTAGWPLGSDGGGSVEKEETALGEPPTPGAAGRAAGDEWEARWAGAGDPETPRNLPKWRKWLCTGVVSSASLCV